jgi:glycerol-3-phosphate dehydrogenase
MAELTMNKVCEQLGVERNCKTAETSVPGVDQGHYWLGHRLHEVEEEKLQGELVCECELVTRRMLEHAAGANPTVTLDDLRRDIRLGMGPCQGGFCTYRAVGILHEISEASIAEDADGSAWDVAYMQSPSHIERTSPAPSAPCSSPPLLLLRDFLQERWKGLTPILWGQQLKQERLDELIYLSLMNVDHLPEAEDKSPLTDFYRTDTTPRSGSGRVTSASEKEPADV